MILFVAPLSLNILKDLGTIEILQLLYTLPIGPFHGISDRARAADAEKKKFG